MKEITQEQFARWSFERDFKAGDFEDEEDNDVSGNWVEIPDDLRAVYFQEAEYYLNKHPKEDWPVDILERIK